MNHLLQAAGRVRASQRETVAVVTAALRAYLRPGAEASGPLTPTMLGHTQALMTGPLETLRTLLASHQCLATPPSGPDAPTSVTRYCSSSWAQRPANPMLMIGSPPPTITQQGVV